MDYDNENIYGKYSKIYRDEINKRIEYKINNSTNKKYDFFSNESDIFRFKLDNIIFPYFVCNNGYIGYDTFVTRHCTYHLLFWLNILNSDKTLETEKETAILEIEIFFYQWICCFYNLSQKIYGFIGAKYKNKKIKYNDSALSSIGKQEFTAIIKKYKEIKKIIDARNNVVHDSYVMKFDELKKEMNIRKFAYNLRKNENKDIEISTFMINEEYIVESFKSLMNLLNDFIEIIENMKNIDIGILKKRYTDENGRMSIGFGGE